MQVFTGLSSGVLVGFVLGLVGGGGSILAVPLLAYWVGVRSPHLAIGTSAVAVAVNALGSLVMHARAGAVKWRCATVFSVSGALGALLGSWLGKSIDGQKLLIAFGALMLLVGASMLRTRKGSGKPEVRLTVDSARVLAPRLTGLGLAVGAASGFFGIGGGFLVVPALMWATDMPLSMAVSSSLVAVAAFGVTTAASYASSGLVDWPLALIFILGGTVGAFAGTRLNERLAARKRALGLALALVVLTAGSYVVFRGVDAL